jgi:hypothetical protein
MICKIRIVQQDSMVELPDASRDRAIATLAKPARCRSRGMFRGLRRSAIENAKVDR